jgi:hypothetical protein
MKNTSLILTVTLSLLSSARAGDLPGTAYAAPPAGTVLRAGPGVDFPGVMTLDGTTVVRVGEARGTYREVFVPQGFAVYMHSDYVAVTRSTASVTVTGDRVNMRLLPSTEGLLPISQLAEGTGPLVFLEQAGEWVRVLAPLATPLFAPGEALQPSDDPALGARWSDALASREARRTSAMDAWRSTDPGWQREGALLERAERLADIDVTRLDEPALLERRAEIARLRGQATWAETQSALLKLDQDIDQVLALRASAARAAEQIKGEPVPVAPEAAVRRESKMLSLGFRFLGRGETVRRAGSVHKEGLDDAPVYTLHTTEGEILKLTAPNDVATLAALVGRRVELDGRKLYLATVSGPVLVIDRIVSYRPQ